MRRLTSPQTLGLSYQYLVYAYFRHRGRRVTVYRGGLSARWKEKPALSGVEDCNREGVLRGTFPSLPTVCSFRAATPYLQVQCLLSLIHIPWPTHPYYPWLSTRLRTYPFPKCTCLHRASQKAIVVYPSSLFALFTRVSMRAHIRTHTYTMHSRQGRKLASCEAVLPQSSFESTCSGLKNDKRTA